MFPAAESVEGLPARGKDTTTMATRTILLIDYDPVTVEYTRESLIAAGYSVEVASDGPAGVAAFRESRPDLVLVEAMIPKQHGFEVCKEIKEASQQQTPVVITTSSFAGRKYRTAAQQDYGCDEYLEKPIPKNRLLTVCEELIELAENHALGERAEQEAAFVEEPHVESDESAPALDELNEDELIARLDSMLPEDDELPPEPATFLTVDSSGSEGEMPAYAGDAESLSSPEEAGLPVALTEDDILSQVDTVLSRPQSQAQPPVAQTEAVVPSAVAPPAETRTGRAWIGIAIGATLVGCAVGTYFMGWYPGSSPAQPTRSAPAELSSAAPPVSTPAWKAPPAQNEFVARTTEPLPEPMPAAAKPAITEEVAPPAEPEPIADAQPEPQAPVELAAESAPAPTELIAQLPVHETVVDQRSESEAEPSLEVADAQSAPVEPEPVQENETIAIKALPTLPLTAPVAEPVVAAEPPAPPKTLPGALVELAETDTAPVGTHLTPPQYDRISRHLREQGIVEMNLLIDEKGRVVDVEVTRGVNSRLDKSAARGVRDWRYDPATKDGVPVKTWMSVQVEFKL